MREGIENKRKKIEADAETVMDPERLWNARKHKRMEMIREGKQKKTRPPLIQKDVVGKDDGALFALPRLKVEIPKSGALLS
jgi:hypothetical protein